MSATQTDVGKRVDARIEQEKKEIQAEITQAGKTRADAVAEHDAANAKLDKLSDEAIKAEDAGKEFAEGKQKELNDANARTLRAINTVVGVGTKVTRLKAELDALDQPKERERRIAQAERLDGLKATATGKGKGEGKGTRGPTAKDAAAAILRDARKPLHYREITKRGLDSGMFKLKGKTPEATINSMLAVDAKNDGVFVKVDAGVFDLRERVEKATDKAEEPKAKAKVAA